MAVLLGTLALVVALVAVWYTVEAVKRIDVRNEAAVRPFVGDLKRVVDEEARMLQAVSVRLDAIERDVKLLKLEGIELGDVEPHVAATRKAVRHAQRHAQRYQPTLALNG